MASKHADSAASGAARSRWLTLMHLLSIRPCARNALTFALLEPAAAILYRTPQTTRFPGPKRPG